MTGALIIFWQGQASAAGNELLTNLLSRYVSEGKTNYTDLCKDGDLNAYIEQLSAADPKAIGDDKDRFAFWLNVYNAYSLKAICNKYPIKSVNDLNFGGLVFSVLVKKSVWDRPFVMVGHKPYTLRQVDHEILRPIFKDPRIQFAIACGAVGCAASRSEAYEGATLDSQLDDQTKKFINDPRLNAFDKDKMTAEISPLFNWSRKDFGKNEAELLVYIAYYLPADVAEAIRRNPAAWKVKYNAYDLTLNDAKN
jgi:hypothetical protein